MLLRHLRGKQSGVFFHGRWRKVAAVYKDPLANSEWQTDVPQGSQTELTDSHAEPAESIAATECPAKSTDGCQLSSLEIEIADEAASVIHHDRQTLTVMGWLFIRFRPAYYWWEFVIMGRKATLTLVVVFLGTQGAIALSLTLAGTLITLGLQKRHAPFREDALTFAAERRAEIRRRNRATHAPWESRSRRALRRMKEYSEMPSLNGLQLAALTTHLITLVCGLLCLVSGNPDSGLAIAAGYASLAAIVFFVCLVVRYIRPRCGSNHERQVQSDFVGGGRSIRSRSRRIQPVQAAPEASAKPKALTVQVAHTTSSKRGRTRKIAHKGAASDTKSKELEVQGRRRPHLKSAGDPANSIDA